MKSHVVATNLIDLHIVENGSARLSFVRVSAQSHPDVQDYGWLGRPSGCPAYPQKEIWAGLVGLLDGSGIETAPMYL